MMTRHSIQSLGFGTVLMFSALACNDPKTVGTIENSGGTHAAAGTGDTGGTLAAGGAANGGAPSDGGAPGAGGASDSNASTGGATTGTGGAAANSQRVDFIENDAGQLIMPAPVLDPSGTYAGKTPAEWGVAYWQWLVGLPGPYFPTNDSTGSFCALGQSDADDGGSGSPVFFLAAAFSPSTVTRSCAVPADKMLFIPLAGIEWDNAHQPADNQLTDDQLKDLITTVVNSASSQTLEIDGKIYGSQMSDFEAYRVPPTECSFSVPNTPTNYAWRYPNTFSTTPFSGLVPKAFLSGYGILLAPLSVGSHTIHYTITFEPIPASDLFPEGLDQGAQDITYNLTVQ